MTTKVEQFRSWWNRVVTLRIKALVYTGAVVVLLVVGFQIQTGQLAADRVDDVEQNAVNVCLQRVETRENLRDVLLYVVDLRDVLPGSEGAEAYTANRKAFIADRYPALDPDDCGDR